MQASQQKIVQYLSEARATEDALVRVLQSQIAMTPSGSYRSALDKHLTETRQHSKRVSDRLEALGAGGNPLMVAVGFWETVIGQALAFSKTPLDLLRGSGGEEKVLKNAKDACATEALEIATYTAIVRLARSVEDEETTPTTAMVAEVRDGMLYVFLPPTALKLMRLADVRHDGVKLRSIFTGGESLGAELLDWVRTTFGIEAHEVFGQTECNLVVGNNAKLFPIRPGSMGKATPGFDVRIVNDNGEELSRGERGIIGVRQPNPCTMIEYWKNPQATRRVGASH